MGISGKTIPVCMHAFAHECFGCVVRACAHVHCRGLEPGLSARIADELARRAKFTWRESWGLYKHPSDYGLTFTETVLDIVQAHDVAGWWFMQTPDRLAAGIAFPKGYVDATFLVTTMSEEGRKVPYFSIFNHFDPWLWVCIVGAMLFSSVIYWFLEGGTDDGDLGGEEALHPMSQSIYLTAGAVVGAAGYGPRTIAGKLFAWSWGFWCLLVLAAYTASLASAFTVQAATKTSIQNIHDLDKVGGPVCVIADGLIEGYLVCHV